jgi:hypothetical protein
MDPAAAAGEGEGERPAGGGGRCRVVEMLAAQLAEQQLTEGGSSAAPGDVGGGGERKRSKAERAAAEVRMRPSAFAGIPSTVFFDYPAELVTNRNDTSVVELLGNRKLRYDTHW